MNLEDFDVALAEEDALANAVSSAPRTLPEERTVLGFEGRAVDRTEIAVKGLSRLPDAYDGLQIKIDDRVRVIVEGRVVQVGHYVDKNGQLVRCQTLQVGQADIVPWDPSNPDDDGVIRA